MKLQSMGCHTCKKERKKEKKRKEWPPPTPPPKQNRTRKQHQQKNKKQNKKQGTKLVKASVHHPRLDSPLSPVALDGMMGDGM